MRPLKIKRGENPTSNKSYYLASTSHILSLVVWCCRWNRVGFTRRNILSLPYFSPRWWCCWWIQYLSREHLYWDIVSSYRRDNLLIISSHPVPHDTTLCLSDKSKLFSTESWGHLEGLGNIFRPPNYMKTSINLGLKITFPRQVFDKGK